jgi:hypothetical protein
MVKEIYPTAFLQATKKWLMTCGKWFSIGYYRNAHSSDGIINNDQEKCGNREFTHYLKWTAILMNCS